MDPYNPSAITSTANGTDITRKIDIYSLLQAALFQNLAPDRDDRILRAMITLLLKTHETDYKYGHAFVFCADIAEKIGADVKELAAEVAEEIENERFLEKISCHNHHYVSQIFQRCMQTVCWDSYTIPRMEFFQKRFFIENRTNSSFPQLFNIIVHKLKRIEMFLQRWLKKIPKLAGPKHVIQIIRDGENSYVLEEEVKAAEGPIQPARIFRTLPVEETEILKEGVEIIETRIHRTKHFAQPIFTSTGRFCKTALDVFRQVLRGLFFGFRVPQKIKKNEWRDVETFFNELKGYFDPEQKSVYLLDKPDIDRIREAMEDNFNHLESRSAKDVRTPNKLTVESVKKELTYLGITALFPDSLSRVEESLKGTNETPDIFDAIGYCLTGCLFKRIPWLGVFADNQKNGFNRSNAPEGSQLTKRFSKSCWKDVDLSKDFLKSHNSCVLETQSCNLFYNTMAQVEIAYGYTAKQCYSRNKTFAMNGKVEALKKNWKPEVFIVDEKEVRTRKEKCGKRRDPKDLQNALETCQEFQNLEAYTKLNPKRVYLRTFNNSVYSRKEDRRVFTMEVLKAIPLLLEQQGDRVDDEKLEKFRVTDVNAMMNLVQLQEILEEFDVNKELLALTPDSVHSNASLLYMKVACGIPVVEFPNPLWVPVMEVPMAKFHIFQSVVCDVDWAKEVLHEPENSKEHFKAMVIEEMNKLGNEGVVTKEAVKGVIEKLKEHPNYKERMERKILTPLIKLFDARFLDTISLAFFQSECQSAGIECRRPDRTTRKDLEDQQLAVWKARLLFLNAWIGKFFSGMMEDDLERTIRMGLLHKVPIFYWELDTDFVDLIFLDNKNGRRMNLRDDLKVFELASLHISQFLYNHSWLQGTSFRDREYIERCELWEEHADLRELGTVQEAMSEKIESDYGARDAESNKMLRGMIVMQNGIKSWVKEMFRAENAKFYGSSGSTPQEIAKVKELRNNLRYVMEEMEKKTPVNSEDEESEDEEALELLESVQSEYPMESRAKKIQRLREKRERKYPKVPVEDSGAGPSEEGSDGGGGMTIEQITELVERCNRAFDGAIELDRELDEMEREAFADLDEEESDEEESDESESDEEESDEPEAQNVEVRNEVTAAVERRIAELEAQLQRCFQEGPSTPVEPQSGLNAAENRNSRQKKKAEAFSDLPGPSSSANSKNLQHQEKKKEIPKGASRASESPATSRSGNGSLPRASPEVAAPPKNLPKGIDPRESKRCDKCYGMSELCKLREKEITLGNNKIEKVQRDMGRIQREADSAMEEKRREWEAERMGYEAQLQEKDELLRQIKDQLDMMTKRVDTHRMSNTLLIKENAELKASNAYQHQVIQLLRSQVHPETVLALKIRPSLEMRVILGDLLNKQDKIKSGVLNSKAKKKVYVEFFGLTEESELREFAKWHLTNFQMELTEYENAVIRNIELIQSTPLITPAELPKVPDEPDLSQMFYTKLRHLQAVRNQSIDEQCGVCWYQPGEEVERDQGGWTQCDGCKKKFHKDCIRDWFQVRPTRECPFCTVGTDIPI